MAMLSPDPVPTLSSSVRLGPGDADPVAELFSELDIRIAAEHVLPSTPASHAPCPVALGPATRAFAEQAHPRGLYRHQALALDALADGSDVCLETPTASGKSLVFQLAARDILEREPSAKVIALYPAKALIEDQQDKWTAALAGTSLRVTRIHGGIPVHERKALVASSQVILMTPDVLHAWVMSQLSDRAIRSLLGSVRLLILDEAHVYDGVFGSNAAFLMRRLRVAMDACREGGAFPKLLSATATVGDAAGFIERLTGRRPVVIGPDQDGSPRYEKRILVGAVDPADAFDTKVRLLRALARGTGGRFLAFVDSRRMVEQVCAVAERQDATESEDAEASPASTSEVAAEDLVTAALAGAPSVMPYRAGYEDCDRTEIQRALAEGKLRGVVSTSALELGIDIGDLETVICLGRPPTMKSFWQRIGRAGRRGPATCMILDSQREAPSSDDELREYLAQPIEPNWLYLDNRYLQFAQAQCAARELADLGRSFDDAGDLASLPETFRDYLANELDPREPIPQDLFALKQRCGATAPQYAFPLRSAAEENFEIHRHGADRMGQISFAQALREAYPGGIYLHLARGHRVTTFNQRQGRIEVVRCPYGTTRPILQAMIFPDFRTGVLSALTSDVGFVAEVGLQVSERLLGFLEQRGRTREEHLYGAGSRHAQRPIVRFFESTGVCLSFDDDGDELADEQLVEASLARGCARLGINPRDVGHGRFHATFAFGREGRVRGWCIYDTTWGSLRLTSRFVSELPAILEDLRIAPSTPASVVARVERLAVKLGQCRRFVASAGPIWGGVSAEAGDAQRSTAVIVIAPGSIGMHVDGTVAEEVTIEEVVYMPQGLMYRVRQDGGRRFVSVATVKPVHGVSRRQRFDPSTYEAEDLGIDEDLA